ncbi:MAG: hypothetical protein A2722_00915 [Candidatus Doudnabacteria bacterium RIFCSPHIGHO2_01_FULL_50_11]|uniref:Uncharacterized protein n=1 Tax=Candidatus Doudnabacteria bacterium RIFCSPHIGHO2_01_FULL_50_11 TaxID=1817828 RepID=A0A1F5PEV3_9BACT|nr:MAG: hypothetical protein A2722_00915 [Candidatus Doudnabacteria bacterium RIFCSPHIGHO2_01_FULL_50_11]
MRILVKAKPRSKVEKVERVGQPTLDLGDKKTELVVYKVSVKEPLVDGRANEAVVKALAKYFDVAISNVRLVSGETSRQKIFEIS